MMRSSLVKPWGQITGGDAEKTFPQQQGKSLSRVSDWFSAQPYGLYANLPDGQLFKIIDPEGRVIMGVTVERPSGIEQGEVTLHHPGTGARIHLKNDNDIDIITPGNINITAIKTTVNGNFEVTGETDLSATVRSNSVNISDTHQHSGVQSGGSNTGNPI